MARKLLLVNLVLALAILGLGLQLIGSWRAFDRQQKSTQMMAELPALQRTPPLEFDQPPSLLDYRLIAERNLFAENRQASGEEIYKSDPWPPPALILHSTLILGERREATVTELEASGRPRRQGSRMRVSPRDVVQGYTVSEITDNTIVLRRNGKGVVIEKELRSPQPPDGSRIAAGGINIFRIGTPAAPVEATAPANSGEQQKADSRVQ